MSIGCSASSRRAGCSPSPCLRTSAMTAAPKAGASDVRERRGPARAIWALHRRALPGFPEHHLDRGRRPDPVDVRGSIGDGPGERSRERRRCRGRRRALSRGALGSRDVGADLPDLSWLDIDTTYATFEEPVYEQVLADYERDAGVMPVFLLEASYENEHGTSMNRLRSQMYQPVLSGGCGFVFGNFPIWSFWDPGDPGWPSRTAGSPAAGRQHSAATGANPRVLQASSSDPCRGRSFSRTLDHVIVTAGAGTYGEETYALAASTPDHRRRRCLIHGPAHGNDRHERASPARCGLASSIPQSASSRSSPGSPLPEVRLARDMRRLG